MITAYFIEAQALHLVTPDIASQEAVKVFGCIAEPIEILTQRDDDIWALSSRILDKLQLVQTSPARLVVAGHYDLFLLNGEGQMTKLRVLSLEYGGIEAVVILLDISKV